MQQTQKYDLNLIELDDPFSPEPINQNTQKLAAKLSALDGADAALGERVTVLEGHKLAVGTYIGSSSTHGVFQNIALGFKPRLVYVFCARLGHCLVTPSQPYQASGVVITENGFKVSCNSSCNMNYKGDYFLYFAVK